MGQLEKYGLYVLCLVIFLILGVTLWGGGDTVPPATKTVAANDGGRGAASLVSSPASGGSTATRSTFDLLLGPAGDDPKKPAGPAAQPNAPANAPANGNAGNGGTATDASATRPAAGKDDAASGAKPEAPASVVYKVQDGDTFGSLARTKLGSEALWPEIQKLNPTIKPERLRAGDEIRMPTAAAIAAKQAAKAARGAALDKPLPQASDGKRFYTVRKGDNFERIASSQLGSKRRAKELMELNSSVSPERLQLGMRIELPAK